MFQRLWKHLREGVPALLDWFRGRRQADDRLQPTPETEEPAPEAARREIPPAPEGIAQTEGRPAPIEPEPITPTEVSSPVTEAPSGEPPDSLQPPSIPTGGSPSIPEARQAPIDMPEVPELPTERLRSELELPPKAPESPPVAATPEKAEEPTPALEGIPAQSWPTDEPETAPSAPGGLSFAPGEVGAAPEIDDQVGIDLPELPELEQEAAEPDVFRQRWESRRRRKTRHRPWAGPQAEPAEATADILAELGEQPMAEAAQVAAVPQAAQAPGADRAGGGGQNQDAVLAELQRITQVLADIKTGQEAQTNVLEELAQIIPTLGTVG